jgi:WD40 repeat protein
MKKRNLALLLCLYLTLAGTIDAQSITPADRQVITAENVHRLRYISTLGQAPVSDVQWSPDGVTLAAADAGGISLYDAFDLAAEPRRFIPPVPGINRVAFSSDGRLLVAAGQDGYTRVWDVERGDMVREFPAATGTVGVIRFSPDDMLLLTSADDGDYQTPDMIELWDTATWERAAELEVEGPVLQAMFSLDGSQLLTATTVSDWWFYGGRLRLWDVEAVLRGDPDAAVMLHDGDETRINVTGALFTPDGEWVIAHIGERFHWWNIATGEQIEGQHHGVRRAYLFPTPYANGIALVRGEGDPFLELALWDFTRGGRVGAVQLDEGWSGIQSARTAVSPDGAHFIVATGETISRWLVDDPSEPQEWHVYKPSRVTWDRLQLVFSPNGSLLAHVTYGQIDIWDMETGALYTTLETGRRQAESVQFSSDGTRLLAIAHPGGYIMLWGVHPP